MGFWGFGDLNGQQESRKRAKLRSGDFVEVLDFKIKIV